MRKLIASLLKKQSIKYLVRSKAKVVAITGSIGKTSTTQAIATVLEQQYSVRKTLHNYNTDVGVPCSIFAVELPSNVKNPFSWLYILLKNQFTLFFSKQHIDFFVLELGTDSTGEIEQFSWLRPDINVVTAIAPEHMEQFVSIESVAKEELQASHYSDVTIINKLMVDDKYLKHADTNELFSYDRSDVSVLIDLNRLNVVGSHSLDAVAAAIKVAKLLGLSDEKIIQGLLLIKSQKGRMNKLDGILSSILIDDTYNSSPEAVIAALDYLYETDAVQKIALLGNMNELGEVSKQEHTNIGRYCEPQKLDLVVTLGPEANKYTAHAARANGCKVVTTATPYEAVDAIKEVLKNNSLVLLKGSQNGVFAEEATKLLLADKADEVELVRQSTFWDHKKSENFRNYK